MSKRIVITGLGTVSSTGTGKKAFWSNLVGGQSGIKEITLFDTSRVASKTAGEITEFKAQDILQGMKVNSLDRTAQLVCAAAKLGLEDAGLELTEEIKPRIGVIVGNTLGSMHGYSYFDRTALTDGYLSASPMGFTNTIPITSAGYVSILFGVACFNGLISTGNSSSLDAINLGASFIRRNRAEMVLAGGVEALYLENFLQFYLPGLLSGSRDGQDELCAPFDKRRNGMILGEGSAMVVLEDYEHARARGATIYAEVLGFGSAFDPQARFQANSTSKSLTKAMRLALDGAGLAPAAIDYASVAANSSIAADRMEAAAIKDVFGPAVDRLQLSAIKSMTGECFSASGAMQVCAAALALNEGVIPPTINYQEPDPDCALPLFSQSRESAVSTALINTLGDSGVAASLIIGKAAQTRRAA